MARMFFFSGELCIKPPGRLKAVPAEHFAVVSVAEDGDAAGGAMVLIAIHLGRGVKVSVMKRTAANKTAISEKNTGQEEAGAAGLEPATSWVTTRLSSI